MTLGQRRRKCDAGHIAPRQERSLRDGAAHDIGVQRQAHTVHKRTGRQSFQEAKLQPESKEALGKAFSATKGVRATLRDRTPSHNPFWRKGLPLFYRSGSSPVKQTFIRSERHKAPKTHPCAGRESRRTVFVASSRAMMPLTLRSLNSLSKALFGLRVATAIECPCSANRERKASTVSGP